MWAIIQKFRILYLGKVWEVKDLAIVFRIPALNILSGRVCSVCNILYKKLKSIMARTLILVSLQAQSIIEFHDGKS